MFIGILAERIILKMLTFSYNFKSSSGKWKIEYLFSKKKKRIHKIDHCLINEGKWKERHSW